MYRKAQYEKLFKEWGWAKKRHRNDWKVIGQKVEQRRKRGKESLVYMDNRLVPTKRLKKEISRQGYMTTLEKFNQDNSKYRYCAVITHD